MNPVQKLQFRVWQWKQGHDTDFRVFIFIFLNTNNQTISHLENPICHVDIQF